MQKQIIVSCLLLIVNLTALAQQPFKVDVDVNQNLDTFYVKMQVPEKLRKKNAVFQFPATAPGTYQTMNIGRFVSHFKAFDAKGNEIKTTFNAPNQYIISKPKKLKSLSYEVAETFDTPLKTLPIYMMAGSSNEKDHALINAHTISGFFKGKQNSPVELKIIGKPTWTQGTALKTKADGYLYANNFDELVDSPILMGNMTQAETVVANTPIKVFVYAESGEITAEMILAQMTNMLKSAEKYLIKLPVDNYTFLYYFLKDTNDGVTGAWEHSYSSEYVLQEKKPTKEYLKTVVDIASHEFFHIVTPLNIHSEIIEHFNFENPTPSKHLWLYEGVTEWNSHIQLFRGGVTNLNEYIATGIKQKILVNELYFNPDWSLVKIAMESFDGGEGAKQYGNIYYKGSIVASYLDIRLLELSDGKYGLREVLLQLIQKYGKGKPFSEEHFFDDLAAMTFPEIKDFANKYIIGNEPLPHEEYLAKIGLKYNRESSKKLEITKMETMTPNQQKLFDAWSVNLPKTKDDLLK